MCIEVAIDSEKPAKPSAQEMAQLLEWLRVQESGGRESKIDGTEREEASADPEADAFELGQYIDALLEPELSKQPLPGVQRRITEALQTLHTDRERASSELASARAHAEAESARLVDRSSALAREVTALRHSFSELDQHVAELSRSSAHVGDRLQNAEQQRKRAEQAALDIERLQHFSRDDGSLSMLPPPFNDFRSAADAAVPARRLLDIARDINR